jgi:hypothetical protein
MATARILAVAMVGSTIYHDHITPARQAGISSDYFRMNIDIEHQQE